MPKKKNEKPVWPYPHVTRMTADTSKNQWVKKIKGRIHNFGVLDDPGAALDKYQRIGPDLHAGRPRKDEKPDGLTLGSLCGRYIASKRVDAEVGTIEPRTLKDYEKAVVDLLERLDPAMPVADLAPQHFAKLRQHLAAKYGVTRLKNTIVWIRQVFSWAEQNRLIPRDERYGGQFAGVPARQIRAHRNQMAANMFSPDEVRQLLVEARPMLKAAILLGLNGAMGNEDCSQICWRHVDLDQRLVTFPRPKTEILREFVLWPETVEALGWMRENRAKPRDPMHDDRVFLTRQGHPLQHGTS